ncbi:hypothetical protein DVH24_033357 [Malus domestica]|uniref:Pentatricopeptide repeat-containing protein n=1 Tax=Malus domestica TaxID=3750 RepID=A0A498JGE0_MALDO|nr:hypothetical protein DVH24_033357 [Malus domestica]
MGNSDFSTLFVANPTKWPQACGRTHLSCYHCWKVLKDRGALELLSQTRICGILLNSVALTIRLSACLHIGVNKLGKAIHGFAIRSCCDGYDNVNSALITLYSKCKDLRKAYTLFELIEDSNIITWNSMLSGYSRIDRADEASLFREMFIIPLFARVANLQHGNEFHCYITKRSALVDMYARSVTYTSMIAGYEVQGAGKAALKLFKEMNLLHMLSVYNIILDIEHYACMVDLFKMLDLLTKLRIFIAKMPYKPASAMWATPIKACRFHGNVETRE